MIPLYRYVANPVFFVAAFALGKGAALCLAYQLLHSGFNEQTSWMIWALITGLIMSEVYYIVRDEKEAFELDRSLQFFHSTIRYRMANDAS